jgi:DNA-binding CsgD family transcriptional regulator
MRRVTVDIAVGELARFEKNPMIGKIESLEILQFLKESPEELAIICRVKFTDPNARLEDFQDEDLIEQQLLERSDDGTYTYFIRSHPSTHEGRAFDLVGDGGYVSLPFEFKDGRARITYLGNVKQVKSFMDGLDALQMKYKVASVTDAKFPRDSPLARLTEKQRDVLITAYRLGYYDEPRRISSAELAKRLKIGASTLINHRRSAERHLLSEIVGH